MSFVRVAAFASGVLFFTLATDASSWRWEEKGKWRELETGIASVYHRGLEGNATASGEPYDPEALTAAHQKLPLRTDVKVTHLKSGRSVVVRINERGPHHARRVIDLSSAAAEELGMNPRGTARVRLEVRYRADDGER